ncbi:hypothetical protein Tco_0261676, partial [Tanacetum coccineum]
ECNWENDKDLAKSKIVVELEGLWSQAVIDAWTMSDGCGGMYGLKDRIKQQKADTSFIVRTIEEENDDGDDEEDEVLFDSVCAFCDNGGQTLSVYYTAVKDIVLRSLSTLDAGFDILASLFCFREIATQYDRYMIPLLSIPIFSMTDNCKFKHQCFACGMLGSSDKSSAAENIPILGGGFMIYCREIAFEDSADGTIAQRAWDDLLPKRILIYCLTNLKWVGLLRSPFTALIRKRDQDGGKYEQSLFPKEEQDYGISDVTGRTF